MYKNNCTVCGKERVYKSKQGFDRAEVNSSPCKSCSNSICRGGNGGIFKGDLKLCSYCREYKSFSEFNIVKTGKNKDKYHSSCKECSKVKSKQYQSETFRFSKYKIDKEYYDNLIVLQNNKCRICKEELINPCIDHNHETGIVRGILCNNCNTALGHFKDKIDNLKEAIKYLQ